MRAIWTHRRPSIRVNAVTLYYTHTHNKHRSLMPQRTAWYEDKIIPTLTVQARVRTHWGPSIRVMPSLSHPLTDTKHRGCVHEIYAESSDCKQISLQSRLKTQQQHNVVQIKPPTSSCFRQSRLKVPCFPTPTPHIWSHKLLHTFI